MTDEQLAFLQQKEDAPFTDEEKAAIDYATELTKGPVSDETFGRLKDHFDARQIVEITMVACVFNLSNRFTTALDVDLTKYPKPL